MKRKVLILIDSLKKGGAEKAGVNLAVALHPYHDVYVYVINATHANEDLKDYLSKNVEKVVFNTSNFSFTIIKLLIYTKRNGIEVIFSFLLRGNILAGIAGQLCGIKKVYGGIRSSLLDHKKVRIQRFLHLYMHTATISNNYSAIDFLKLHGFNVNKIIVIQNFVNKPQSNYVKLAAPGKINILTVARFEIPKDYYTALTAFSILNNEFDNIEYTIVGWGSEEKKIRDLIRELNIESKVRIIINPLNVNQYYSLADLYLSTSLYEGVSNSILEAMSFGLPVVATDVGDNKYLIHQSVNGFLIKEKNFMGVAEVLRKLILNPSLRSEFSANSYRIVENTFSEKQFVEKYLNCINE